MSVLRNSALVWGPVAEGIPRIRVGGALVRDEYSYRGSILFARWSRVLVLRARLVVSVEVHGRFEHFQGRYLVWMFVAL